MVVVYGTCMCTIQDFNHQWCDFKEIHTSLIQYPFHFRLNFDIPMDDIGFLLAFEPLKGKCEMTKKKGEGAFEKND